MTAVTTTRPEQLTTSPTDRPERPSAWEARPLWRTGAVAGVAAATATVAVAGVARAIDIPVEAAPGEAIPLVGFAQLTLVCTAIGVLLARTFARRADRPRSTFVATTLVLTVLSCVPDVALSTDLPSKLTLIATHVVAAAIVIPALAGRLAERATS